MAVGGDGDPLRAPTRAHSNHSRSSQVRSYFEDFSALRLAAALQPWAPEYGFRSCVALSAYAGVAEAVFRLLLGSGPLILLVRVVFAYAISFYLYYAIAHEGGAREHAAAGGLTCALLLFNDLYQAFHPPGGLGFLLSPLCVDRSERVAPSPNSLSPPPPPPPPPPRRRAIADFCARR